MTSMVPYDRYGRAIRSLFPFDSLDEFFVPTSDVAQGFKMDVEDAGDSYVVTAQLPGVGRDEIDVELNEGRLSISVDKKESDEQKAKNFLHKETSEWQATRGVYLKDAATAGLTAKLADGVLTVIAVDGYRLALRREKVESVGEKDLAFIVPGAALADVERLCADTDDVIRVTLGFRHIGFTLGETILITRRLEGDFLNWRKAVPEAFRYHMTLEREELKSAADRVSLVVDERTKNPLRCRFEDGVVTLSCVTALGQAEDACLAEGTGGGLEIGFNSRYLIDALKAAPAQRIVVSISTGSSPCVITPEEGDGFIYMILPVRLRTE